jgi:sterol desaturase/sphingolipid hydroxylase (fatty acid hydroxylase superfamily)
MSTQRGAIALNLRQRIWSDDLLETVRRWGGIDDHPDPANRKRREGIRIFRSDFVERWFSKAHPVMPIVWTGPFIAWGLHRGLVQGRTQPLETLGLILLGILLWTLVEYVLHRWIFHWQPPGDGGKMWSFMVHGYHHEFPDDRMRLVAPPLMLVFFGIIVWTIYAAVFGSDRFIQVFAGTCMGYVAYDWIHYYTHHFHPKRGLGRWLQQYHLRHHFQEDGMRYGISSPLWDLLFGTFRSPRN